MDADNVYVKALDENVVNLIDLAEKLSITSTNATGGGVFLAGSTLQASDLATGVLEVSLLPDAANDAGAGWRLLGGDPTYHVAAKSMVPLLDFDFTLEFRPVPGFIAPTNRIVTIVLGETNRVGAYYRRVQTVEMTTVGPLAVGQPTRLTAFASSGLAVKFELISGEASLNGDIITIGTPNRVVVRARQDGDAEYASAFVERTFESIGEVAPSRPRLSYATSSGLLLTGEIGASYRIEQADAIQSRIAWAPFRTVTLSTSNEAVLGTSTNATGARFYRAVRVP